MLAYLSWHRPAPGVERDAYEQALERFHRSLAHRPPNGFRGSAAMRAPELPWLAGPGGAAAPGAVAGPGYEDWYLVEDWSAIGVLEEAAVSHGHFSAHEQIASRAGVSTGAVYRLIEGRPQLGETHQAVWVTTAPGHDHALAALVGDGMGRGGGMWRRCIGLGPAPELCLLGAELPAGASAARLPQGWSAATYARELVWHG